MPSEVNPLDTCSHYSYEYYSGEPFPCVASCNLSPRQGHFIYGIFFLSRVIFFLIIFAVQLLTEQKEREERV